MAKKFYTDINLLKNELQNAAIQNLAEAPSDPVLGQVYFNTTDNEIYVCVDADAPTWESIGGDIESVTAGAGLTGGGTDGAVTLNVGEGTGITVNADEIKIKNADSLTDDTVVKWDDTNGQLVDTVITDDGTNVGINNTSPSVELDVTGDTKFSGDSDFLNGNYITKSLPVFYMGGSGIDDEYLVICKQVVAIPSEEELEEGESQSDYYQDATGVTGRIYFSRGSENTFNNNGYLDIVAQVSRDSGNVNNLDLSEFKIVGDSLFFTQIEEIDIDGTKYLALKARASGGGSVNHFFFVGNLSDDGADTNILTRVRASDETVTVTDPQPSGFPIAPYMRQDEDGNVGIGTGTPSDKLDVHGIIAVDGAALIDKNNNTVTIGDIDGADDIGFLDINTANASTRVFLDDSGNVGINTSTPLSELHIVGENGTARIDNTSSTKSFSLTTMDSNNRFRIYDNTSDAERLTITNGGNVGIGTTSPATSLHVNGFARLAGSLQLSGSNRYVYAINDTSLLLGTNNTERMRITNTGNVGIGQSNPVENLEIYDASANTWVVVETGSNNAGTQFINTTSAWTVGIKGADSDKFYIGNQEGLSSGYFVLDTSGNLQLTAYTEGYLKSDASGNITVDTSIIEDTLDSVTTRGNTTTNAITVGGLTVDTDTLHVDATNNRVGIGTASPSRKLHLIGGDVYVPTTSDTAGTGSFGGNSFEIRNSTTGEHFNIDIYNRTTSAWYTPLHIQNTGNVGIGATSPGSTLHVDGTVRFVNSGFAGFEAHNTNGTWESFIGTETGGGGNRYNSASSQHTFYNNSTAVMRIDSSGNVGIGTATPAEKLDINGNAIVRGRIYFDGTTSSYIDNISNGITLRSDNEFKVDTYSGGWQNRMTITDAGNVGIGTASPSEKLHVSGDVRIEGDLTVNGSYTQIDTDVNTTEQWNVTNDGTGPAVTINQKGAQDIMDVQDDGTSVFYIEDGGNVGIGTTDPAAGAIGGVGRALNISSSGNGLIMIDHTDGGAGSDIGSIQFARNTDPLAIIKATHEGATDAAMLTFHTQPTGSDFSGFNLERMRIRSTGSIRFNEYGSNTFTGTAAYALAVDSSGNVIETTVQTSPAGIDGTGTVGYLTKWSTTDTITDSVIFESSGNIGIGTASPGAELHVYSSTDNTLGIFESGDNLATIRLSDNDTSGYWHTQNSGTQIGINSSYSTENLTIRSGGNVGIGTTSPSEKLDVNGNIQVGDRLLATPSNWGYASSYKTLILGSSGTDYTTDAVTISFGVDVSSNTNSLFTGNGSELLFRNVAHFKTPNSDDTAYLSLMSFNDGNVGIGTTGPAVKLHVDSGTTNHVALFESTDSTAYIQLRDNTGYSNIVNAFGHLVFEADQGQDQADSYMQFKIDASEKMRIIANGNVGIGTTSPAGRLELNGSGQSWSTAPAIRMWDSYNSKGWLVGNVNNITAGDFYIRTLPGEDTNPGASNNEFTIKHATGNVGIGTTSPGYKLDINAGSDNVGAIIRSSDSVAQIAFRDSTTGGDTNVRLGATGPDMTFFTGGSEKIRITSDGNVGIGTTSPSQKLHILNGNIQIQNETQGGDALILFDNNYTQEWAIGMTNTAGPVRDFVIYETSTGSSTDATNPRYIFNGNGDGIFQITDAADGDINVSLNTNGDSYLSGGNVGIGVNNPDFKLQVRTPAVQSGSDYAWSFDLTRADSATRGFSIGQGSGGGTVAFGGHNTDMALGHTFGTDSNGNPAFYETMRIQHVDQAVGNVGIGTTSPSNKLDVRGLTRLNALSLRGGADNYAHLSRFSWRDTNSSSSGTTWKKVCGVSLGTGNYSAVSVDVVHYYPDSNHGNSASLKKRYYSISFRRSSGTEDNQDDAIVYGLNPNYIRVVRTALGEFELQARANIDNRSYSVDITQTGGNSDAITMVENSSTNGNTTGTTYTAVASANTRIELPGDLAVGKNVGIGTTSPASVLHIKNSVPEIVLEDSDVANRKGKVLANNGNLGLFADSDNVQSDSIIYFNIDSSEKMRITYSGNVGIGATSPDSKLHLQSPSATGAIINLETTHSSGIPIYNLKGAHSAQLRYQDENGNNQSRIDFLDGGDFNFIDATDGTSHLKINSNGNVGIGTTSPGSKLEVRNTDNTVVDTTLATWTSNTTLTLWNLSTTNTTGNFITYANAAGSGSRWYTGSLGASSYSSPFVIGNRTGSATVAERMRIHGNGNISVGTTNAYARFSVKATSHNNGISVNRQADTTAAIYIGNDGGNNPVLAANNADMLFGRDVSGTFTERMRLTNGGNLGIGTTSPGYRLHLNTNTGTLASFDNGDGAIWSTLTNTKSIGLSSGTNYAAGSNFTWMKLTGGSSGSMIFSVNTERMRIASNGNVGIGTTNPTQKFQVNGSSTFSVNVDNTAYVRFGNLGSSSDIATVESLGDVVVAIDSNDSSTGKKFAVRNNGVSGDELMTVLDTGNVGIGTTSPKAALDVKGRFVVNTKTMTITDAFSDALTVVMSNHTGCYVKITAFGDWGSHSSISYLGEFFLNNGAGSYNEPGMIIRQEDNTHTDAIQAQIVDPGGTSGNRNFVIQLKATNTASFTAYITYTIQGMFVSAS